MAKYRVFTEADWYGYGGAEPFSSSHDPLIYERRLNEDDHEGYLNEESVEMVILVDKCGIEIDIYTEDADMIYHKEKNLTFIQAEGELSHLIEYLEKLAYAQEVTYELDYPTSELTKGFEKIN